MSDVVRKIIQKIGRNRIEVLRIEAHGTITGPGILINAIQFGAAMDATTVRVFRSIMGHMSSFYSGPPIFDATPGRAYYATVFPRIEMHCCRVVPICNSILQALAEAVHAPVFASSADQDVDARTGSDPFGFEGPVFRFEPVQLLP